MILNNRKEIVNLLKEHDCKIGIELGVSAGHYSNFLLKNYNFDIFYSVDSWNSRKHLVDQYFEAYKRLKNYNNNYIIRAEFDEVLLLFEDNYFDFIYIDGYAHLGSDPELDNWFPKLKTGGIYAGHDYSDTFPRNITSVNNFVKKNNLKLNVTNIPDNADGPDRYPSWWLIK